MPVSALYAKPNEDFVGACTISATAEDTTYTVQNAKNDNPALVYKANATSATITMTGASVMIEGFCIFNHNLVGSTATLANGAGYSQSITIPARRSSGAVVNAWRDARLDANRTSTSWTLTISGAAANIQIGRLYLVQTWYDLPHQWEIEWDDERVVVPPYETFHKHKVIYDTLVNIRSARGMVVSHAAFNDLYDLYHAAKGIITPWPMIPDYTVNDPLYVQFTTPNFKWKRTAPLYTPVELAIAEASAGAAP